MEVNDVEEVKVVDDNEEITAPEAEEAEQVPRLPTPEAPTLSEILEHRAVLRGMAENLGICHANPVEVEKCRPCRSTIVSSATKVTS